MQEECDGKNYCEVQAANTVFGDPCAGVRKYLTSTWRCLTPGGKLLISFISRDTRSSKNVGILSSKNVEHRSIVECSNFGESSRS